MILPNFCNIVFTNKNGSKQIIFKDAKLDEL